jgi:4-amino-4-deoxy-L-arabinose transferase-like glycosyltransferase
MLSLLTLAWCLPRGLTLLYGDAVAHLHIARRITDSINPGFRQLGSVWLPLPHLLLLPFVQKLAWWQSGFAGAPPSMLAYVLGTAGLYRLARYWLPARGAIVAAAFYALNPGLLYLQTTAMNEPLFLAEMIWAALLLTSYSRALAAGVNANVTVTVTDSAPGGPGRNIPDRSIRRLLLALALVLAAAVFTRYDGWVYAALAWCFAAWLAFSTRSLRRPSGGAFVLFTAIVLAAPLFWLTYNQKQFHDPLDFMRGPYSARAIEIKSTPPGASHYPGWHRIGIAAHYFLKAAELGAAPPRLGNVLLVAALAGAAVAVRRRQARAVLALFWLPWAFYAYSVAYGSVPIFIPPWPPWAWYNTRYGLELLPAFALGLAFAADAALAWLGRHTRSNLLPGVRPAAVALGTMLVLVAFNSIALLRARPLVFDEAVVNSRTRIPFEGALARALAALPPSGTIIMYTSDHIGAVEQAGIPLRRTINDSDDRVWTAALPHPGEVAPFVVAIDGDPLARAVSAHPEGLTLLDVICSTGQPCARIYAGQTYPGPAKPSRPAGSGSISRK